MRVDITHGAHRPQPVRLQLVSGASQPLSESPSSKTAPAASRTGMSSAPPRSESAFAAGRRLPCEPEDAYLNGLRRSLQRRVMGLNFPRPELEEDILRSA